MDSLSYLNHYEGSSASLNFLDTLSWPVRIILGGKTVNLVENTSVEKSLYTKIAIVFAALLIGYLSTPALAIALAVSVGSLGLKWALFDPPKIPPNKPAAPVFAHVVDADSPKIAAYAEKALREVFPNENVALLALDGSGRPKDIAQVNYMREKVEELKLRLAEGAKLIILFCGRPAVNQDGPLYDATQELINDKRNPAIAVEIIGAEYTLEGTYRFKYDNSSGPSTESLTPILERIKRDAEERSATLPL